MRVRARTVTKLPASLSATGGLKVEKESGVWTFAPDWSALSLETTIPAPEARQLWILNPNTGVYTRLSVQALIDNLPAGPAGPAGQTGPSAGVQFVFDSETGDADPGSGKFRFDNATISSVTQAFFDNTDASGASVTAWLDSFDDSTNTAKGSLFARGITDPNDWVLFNVSGSVVDGTGYRKVTLTYVAHNGTLTDGDTLAFSFFRAGDKGADGAGTGDVSHASATSVDNEIVLFSGTGGKTVKRATTTGVLKASSGVIAAAVAGTDYLAPAAIGVTVQGYDANTSKTNANETFSGIKTFTEAFKLMGALEKAYPLGAAPASTQNFDQKSYSILRSVTNAANNWTLNVRGNGSTTLNSRMAVDEAISIVLVTTQGATAYYQTAMQIDGSAVTPKWIGGAPTAGTPNSREWYFFTIFKTADATFAVDAQKIAFT